MSEARTVALIGAGGTIAMGARHRFDWVDYGDSGIVRDAAELVAMFGEILPGVTLKPVAFRALGSVAIGWADWCELLALAEGLVADDPDLAGIVVTHGTATLEETAFFLHLTWAHDIPLIVVGAQRPPETVGSDAIPNVRAAAALAASGQARGMGALVVMNGQIFAAADVSKTANFTLDAFAAPAGPLGRVDADGTVRLARRLTAARRTFAPVEVAPRVDMLLSHSGGDGAAVSAFRAAGAQGIVVAALPPGRVASGERAPLVEAAAAGITIVLASRAARDGVPVQPYQRRDGMLAAGDLAPHKARILLQLALGEGLDASAIQHLLLTIG